MSFTAFLIAFGVGAVLADILLLFIAAIFDSKRLAEIVLLLLIKNILIIVAGIVLGGWPLFYALLLASL